MTPSSGRRWIRASIAIGIFAVTVATFASVRRFDFINYDDDEYVTRNDHVRHGLSVDSIGWSFTTFHAANWHPLTWISHMLDCTLFGVRPGPAHMTNVVLHATNGALLFAFLAATTGATGQSAFVASVFALHPLRVESVAWVSERKDVLSTFFFLLSLFAYV